MSALDELLEKGVAETTSLEHAIQVLYLNEATKGKPLANEAATELSALRAAVDALRKIAAGNPADVGGWLTDVEMAEIAREALRPLDAPMKS